MPPAEVVCFLSELCQVSRKGPVVRWKTSVSLKDPPVHGYSTNPPLTYPPRNKAVIAGLIKEKQWLRSPDHKALFLGVVRGPGGVG